MFGFRRKLLFSSGHLKFLPGWLPGLCLGDYCPQMLRGDNHNAKYRTWLPWGGSWGLRKLWIPGRCELKMCVDGGPQVCVCVGGGGQGERGTSTGEALSSCRQHTPDHSGFGETAT